MTPCYRHVGALALSTLAVDCSRPLKTGLDKDRNARYGGHDESNRQLDRAPSEAWFALAPCVEHMQKTFAFGV